MVRLKKEWSAVNDKNYMWLYNYLKTIYGEDLDEYEFIDKYKRQIMSIIEKNDKWSDGSKEALLFTCAKYLKLFGNERYGKMYSEAGYKYLQKNREKEGENKQSDKEILNYRDHEFFEDILNSINYDDIQTLAAHYQYLLLSMLVYQPPVRTDFYCTAQFIRTKEENDKVHNFIRIDRRGKVKITYIINNDKVSKTRTYAMNKELSKIPVENQKLADLINDSYIKYPRTYLFENKDKPITQPTFLSMLKKITKVDGINNDMMRSSYINWFYQHHKSLKERDALALQMRHSTGTAMRNYFKLADETPEEKEHTVSILQKEIFEVKTNCDNDTSNDKEYRKKRRDVIYTLNKGSKPRESTLQKYNITFNKETNKYE
jgi:hypothetical protein